MLDFPFEMPLALAAVGAVVAESLLGKFVQRVARVVLAPLYQHSYPTYQ